MYVQALDRFVDDKLDICKAVRDVDMDQGILNQVREGPALCCGWQVRKASHGIKLHKWRARGRLGSGQRLVGVLCEQGQVMQMKHAPRIAQSARPKNIPLSRWPKGACS